jgi:putative hydrolase of the HAD superfamily
MPSAILFDAVGTLIYPHPPVAAVYAAAGLRLGIEVAENELQTRFLTAFARQEAIDRQQFGLKTSADRERHRWREIVGDVFADAAPSVSRREELFHSLWNHFAQPESWRTYDDVAPCWKALEARGLTIAITSNFDERLERIVERIAPLNRAKRIYLSATIGYRKPSTDFFRAVEVDLGLQSTELISVGDDVENDHSGAQAAGWHAILVDRSGAHGSQSTHTIDSLAKLPAAVPLEIR